MSQFEAMQLALWDQVSQNISPPGDFSILTELGIDLLDESGVALLIE